MWRTTIPLFLVLVVVNSIPSKIDWNDAKYVKSIFQNRLHSKLLSVEPADDTVITHIDNLIIEQLNIHQSGFNITDSSGCRQFGRDAAELDWWESTIFYQIYPRSFMDSDGDGIGDLNGVTSKLEYLKELGIGATWLSPIFQSPMYDFGYDISDFYAVHDEYGTMEDFENLLVKAKELDIKIVLDFVANHGSNESEWFQKSLQKDEKYSDYFIWEKGTVDENGNRQPPNNWVSVFRKSAWEYREERDEYYLHQFLIGQPDLNYRNPDVVEEMKNVIRFWLEKGVAGFRIDAVINLFEVDKANFGGVYPDEPLSGYLDKGPDDYDYLDHIYTKDQDETYDMVYQWRALFDEFKKIDGFSRVILTEGWSDINKTMLFYGDGERQGSHMPFNFGLITDLDKSSTAKDFKFFTDRWLTYMPLGQTANWVLGNHDTTRVATRYGTERTDGLNIVLLSMPGVAITYMGEEIGMVDGYVSWEDTVDPSGCNTDDPINYVDSSRDPCRTPFQWSSEANAGFSSALKTWLPVADTYEVLNVEQQKGEERSHYKIYQEVSQLRKGNTYKYGTFNSVAFNDDVFAFTRQYSGEPTYIIVWNISENENTIDLSYFSGLTSELKVVVRDTESTKEIGDTVTTTSVILPAYEALVLKTIS